MRVSFPINASTGADSSAVVYFEVEPGERLASHTDSAEEILYIVSGTADAEVGDERGRVSAGDLAVIPAMVPHGLVNVGEDTLRVVGFFSSEDRLDVRRAACSRWAAPGRDGRARPGLSLSRRA